MNLGGDKLKGVSRNVYPTDVGNTTTVEAMTRVHYDQTLQLAGSA